MMTRVDMNHKNSFGREEGGSFNVQRLYETRDLILSWNSVEDMCYRKTVVSTRMYYSCGDVSALINSSANIVLRLIPEHLVVVVVVAHPRGKRCSG